jgi:hypothetical protein
MAEGSAMFFPVWKPGALIYTGDSHAVQGDGEICLTALETRMQELRIQVILHKQKNFAWPVAETSTHWITLGMDKDLNVAMALASRNAIDFLAKRADLTKHDAYALCSVATSFRVTQVVDITRGVHAMIPKSLFAPDLRTGYVQHYSLNLQREIFRNTVVEAGYGEQVCLSHDHAAYGRWFDSPDLAWFTDPTLAGGGAFMDMGTHAVHCLRSLISTASNYVCGDALWCCGRRGFDC